MSSLIDTVRKCFLDAIRSVNPPGKWKILVVDEHAQRLLGAVLKTYDILEENVTLIESITTHRTPQPQFEALYLLMPTTQNVERIIADFSGRQQYGAAHIHFTEGLSEPLFQQLSTSPAKPYLRRVVELFVNFEALEARAFSSNTPSFFFSFFGTPKSSRYLQLARDRLEEHLRFTSRYIVNLCVTMGENPFIRYYHPSHHGPLGPLAIAKAPARAEGSGRWSSSASRDAPAEGGGDHLSKLLAFMVQQELDDYCKSNPEFPKPTEPQRPRGVLLITDRSMDPVAPFLHEFTYQAMCNDLLDIEDGKKYRYKFQSSHGAYEDKLATLSDTDNVWTELRHMHMRETIDKLMADFNKFMEENAGFKGEGAANLSDMKDMLANLPQYQEQREKFSLHLNMAQECMNLFEKKKLSAIGNVEQNCATGLTADGKTPKTLVEEMVPLLDDPSVSNTDKVRIIALYVMHRDGVPEEDRRRLFEHARLSLANQDAINNLAHLGARVTRSQGDRDTRKKLKQKSSTGEEYELSRYTPLVQTVLEDHCSGKLDASVFPYVRDSPVAPSAASAMRTGAVQPTTSLRSSKPSWHRAPRANVNSDAKQRLIVFVAGGMTYSEMRVAYQLSASVGKDIYIGSTHVLTPHRFTEDLKVLELDGVGSIAIPEGLPNVHDGQGKLRPFQAAYDQKYYLEGPPPPRATSAPAVSSERRDHPTLPASPAHSSASLKTHSGILGKPEKGKGADADGEKKKKRHFFGF
ncbi:hypothetical protein BOTBODRAFT_133850 [Botryobasidium botryosum FD-172 SS1]|uniref:Sec1-like protein n=1 Tax=Botryobasidium botryosum (strain FD-172 SS1) TaxID=930990 RepID=A0A067MBP8_BOTB1|nr:hypothetical protein BOTBODRAFT_133850 [Botryobasidium botryosum FD-172 SS1]